MWWSDVFQLTIHNTFCLICLSIFCGNIVEEEKERAFFRAWKTYCVSCPMEVMWFILKKRERDS